MGRTRGKEREKEKEKETGTEVEKESGMERNKERERGQKSTRTSLTLSTSSNHPRRNPTRKRLASKTKPRRCKVQNPRQPQQLLLPPVRVGARVRVVVRGVALHKRRNPMVVSQLPTMKPRARCHRRRVVLRQPTPLQMLLRPSKHLALWTRLRRQVTARKCQGAHRRVLNAQRLLTNAMGLEQSPMLVPPRMAAVQAKLHKARSLNRPQELKTAPSRQQKLVALKTKLIVLPVMAPDASTVAQSVLADRNVVLNHLQTFITCFLFCLVAHHYHFQACRT